jgi:DcmR-like sensory protein
MYPLDSNQAHDSVDGAEPHSHFVQLYETDPRVLVDNVVRFLSDGLHENSNLILVATDEHRDAFLDGLERRGWQTEPALREGRIVCANSREMLSRFMVNGHPDADRFDRSVGETVRESLSRAGDKGIRAYGDMVGVLWAQREFPAAIRLEQLWNALRKKTPFSLLCAYPVDVFDNQFGIGVLDALLCAHTHLLPSGLNGHLEHAVDRAMREVLGDDEQRERLSLGARRDIWATIPKPEGVILWLRNNAPDRADEILALAKQYYQASA